MEFFILSVEKDHPTKDISMNSLIDLIDEVSDNKDVKAATTGFHMKGDVAHSQNIKYIEITKGGKAKNIRPGRIDRQRRRRNKKDKDDEDDGKKDRRPSDSHALYLILGIVIILMLFLIVLSLILLLMS